METAEIGLAIGLVELSDNDVAPSNRIVSLKILDIAKDSVASRSKLEIGDTIFKINGVKPTRSTFKKLFKDHPIQVSVVGYRNGALTCLEVVLR